jgi:hypothetical protein
MFPPSHPSYLALLEKQESLIAKANANKASKVYTLSEFAEGFAMSDSDFEDEIPIYAPSGSKISLETLIENYDRALKDFLTVTEV